MGRTREDPEAPPSDRRRNGSFVCLFARAAFQKKKQRTPTKITAVKQHSCQQRAMWLPSCVPNKADGSQVYENNRMRLWISRHVKVREEALLQAQRSPPALDVPSGPRTPLGPSGGAGKCSSAWRNRAPRPLASKHRI